MKNLYHYTLAMLYLKIAHLYAGKPDGTWGKWMDRSVNQISKVKLD